MNLIGIIFQNWTKKHNVKYSLQAADQEYEYMLLCRGEHLNCDTIMWKYQSETPKLSYRVKSELILFFLVLIGLQDDDLLHGGRGQRKRLRLLQQDPLQVEGLRLQAHIQGKVPRGSCQNWVSPCFRYFPSIIQYCPWLGNVIYEGRCEILFTKYRYVNHCWREIDLFKFFLFRGLS